MEVYANFRDETRIPRSEHWSSEIVKRAKIVSKRREICPVRFLEHEEDPLYGSGLTD